MYKRQKLSLKERFKIWAERQKLKGVSDNTLYRYKTDYARFLKGHDIENRDIRTIDEEYLELYFNKILEENSVLYQTLKELLGYFRGTFDKSIRDGIIENNPCSKIDYPLLKSKCRQPIIKTAEERTFSQIEKNRLMNSLKEKLKKHPDDVRPYAIELALYTGMRVGELSGLMWEDIDETRQCIIIQHSEKYNALKKTFFVSTPKSGKTRVFPLTAEIAALLKNVREVESKYGYLTEFVFSGPNGRIHKTNISSYMIARTSGDGFTNQKSIHTARRTLNSELIASGAPRAMCCALIGNTELVNETFYTYDVSTKNYKLEMVSKINQRTINNNDNINVEKLSSNQE
ncbi:tyrosine-type recombinase/integrase [Coprococcus comes]|uniref:Tyrosine-type recombinase/integrase n=1 Tax=Coprococcus comes TaxID=410072 RepID=A0A849Y1E4_9FIRM|nr:tyrosine-type recombinase/integrase [Coprococcus comes]